MPPSLSCRLWPKVVLHAKMPHSSSIIKPYAYDVRAVKYSAAYFYRDVSDFFKGQAGRLRPQPYFIMHGNMTAFTLLVILSKFMT